MSYRFKVGTEVECRTGRDEWSVGTIVQLNYSEPGWPPGKKVPYQVQLDDGRLIFVPADFDKLCRLHVPVWWQSLFYITGSSFRPKHLALLREKCDCQDVNAADRHGTVALHEAVRLNWQSGVMELLTINADVNIADNDKVQALHICVRHGTELMNILLEAKADPNCRDRNPDYDPNFTSVSFGDRVEHRTPLHYCCAEGLEEQAKMLPALIRAKADLDIQDGQGKTPLHLAIEENNGKFVDILLRSRADVNLGNLSSNFQNSPLMDAAHEGQCDLAMRLISARAAVNMQGKQGLSALHLAARRGNADMIQVLMQARADASQTSDLGTAFDLAKKNGGVKVLELFGAQSSLVNASSVTSISELDAMQRKALFLE
eukprot:gnl/MRDRNA2_/MRDRNA2_83365_c0_seq4.p1 gnl/MRDRNA2_/MRDRNA2_83365_c0~~gnl/MRDRNA2_/MRDRNA2_83365_c0_seq4.p1  ORF type:complete len:374 (+),score=70.67 gnl/MRDRNA2_/MRDRNA2_83365_c0_seq4:131-1252(+)